MAEIIKIGKELERMKDERLTLRERFYKSAIRFLQKVAKRIFFSEEKSAEEKRKPSECESFIEKQDEGVEALKVSMQNETVAYRGDSEVEGDTKAARRFVDRLNKYNAALRNLQKAENRYQNQLLEKLKDTNRRTSQSVMRKHDLEIEKCYRRIEDARKNVETAEKKLIGDKKRYEEEVL